MFVTADYGLYRCLFGFFAGSLTYLAYRRSQRPQTTTEPRLLSDRASIAIAETICLVMVVAFVLGADTGKLSFAAPLVFCVAVFVLADDAGPVSAALASPLMRYLGDRSYSIYMVHSFLALQIIQRGAGVVQKLLHVRILVPHVNELGETSQLIDLGHPLLGDALTILYLAGVVAIAHLTYARIEVPWRNWFNGIADRFEARHLTPLQTPTPVAAPPQPSAGSVRDT
jgi:peptidoglycan/LPS O-acetylase OafA/YrhL